MEEFEQSQKEDSPEEILEFVRRILENNKEAKSKGQGLHKDEEEFNIEGKYPFIMDEQILDELQQYADFNEQEEKDRIEVEENITGVDSNIQVEEVEQQQQQQQSEQIKQQEEKTEEEKEKWIDDVLNIPNQADIDDDDYDYDNDDQESEDDNQQMRDESKGRRKRSNNEDIFDIDKEFFNKLRKGKNEEHESQLAQAEKNRKLYEEVVGDKHRKVQIIILTSTSSSSQTSQNQSFMKSDDEKSGYESTKKIKNQYSSQKHEQNSNHLANASKNTDFLVKEEYISDEENINNQQQNKSEDMDKAIEKNQLEVEEEEKQDQQYKDELQEFFREQLKQDNLKIEDFTNVKYLQEENQFDNLNPENYNNSLQQDSVNPFVTQYNNDYEQQLENLFNNLSLHP